MRHATRELIGPILALLAALCVVLPHQASAAITNGTSITITNNSGASLNPIGGVGGGGEFQVNQLPIGGIGSEVFKTFCLEFSEHFTPGNNYTATINGGAIGGGEWGQTAHYYDPLSNETKWLYGAYHDHAVDLGASGFAYGNANWASALQLVIWRLEGEADVFGTGVNQVWKDHAGNTALAAYDITPGSVYDDATKLYNWVFGAGASLTSTGNANVRVLNLWTSAIDPLLYPQLDMLNSTGDLARDQVIPSKAAQSQLYYQSSESPPVAPEPTTLLIWSGLAIAGVVAAKRRGRAG
jgi:hypothetical protein